MDWFVKAFLKSSLAWLAAGVTLGISMAVHPAWNVYRTAHLHMNLLGFVTMMIFGVAYQVIPRFANVGLLVFVVGLGLLPQTMFGAPARIMVGAGGLMSGAAAYVFVVNIWRTIDGRPDRREAAHDIVAASPVVPIRRSSAK